MIRPSFNLLSCVGIAGLSLAALASGCVDFDDDSAYRVDDRDDADRGTASLRYVNVADIGTVDVWLNGTGPAFTNVAPTQGTGFLELLGGSYRLDAVPAGSANAQNALVNVPEVYAYPGSSSTVVSFGDATTGSALTFEEDFSEVAVGQMRLRFVHTAPGLTPMDLWDVTDAENPVQLYDGLPYGVAADPLLAPAGLILGIDVDDDALPDGTVDLTQLPAGTIANMFAVQSNDGVLGFLAQLPDGSTTLIGPGEQPAVPSAMVRGIHLSAGSDALDLVSGEDVVANLTFQESTAYASLPSGAYSFAFTKPEDPTSLFDFELEELMTDQSYTVLAFGNADSLEGLTLVDDTSDIAETAVRMRLIHASVMHGQVDLWDATDPDNLVAIAQNLSYGRAADPVDLEAGITSTLGVDLNNDQVLDLTFPVEAFEDGSYVNLFLAFAEDETYLSAQMPDGTVQRYSALVGF